MAKRILASGEIYHVLNRGIEKKPIFTNKREYERALIALNFYRFTNVSLGLAHFLNLDVEKRNLVFSRMIQENKLVEILGYCLMPNHFHFLIKQLQANGIRDYLSKFCNSYTRYFNTRNKRVGPLLEGRFKAVRIESEEQLIHTSRYIHLNPVVSFVIERNDLETYPYTSFPEYLGREGICDKELVLASFASIEKYKEFVYDQVDYAKKIELIKHIVLE